MRRPGCQALPSSLLFPDLESGDEFSDILYPIHKQRDKINHESASYFVSSVLSL